MPIQKQLIYVLFKKIMQHCRLLIVSGRLCDKCDKSTRLKRSEYGKLMSDKTSLLNMEYVDLNVLVQINLKFEKLWKETACVKDYVPNCCVQCKAPHQVSNPKKDIVAASQKWAADESCSEFVSLALLLVRKKVNTCNVLTRYEKKVQYVMTAS